MSARKLHRSHLFVGLFVVAVVVTVLGRLLIDQDNELPDRKFNTGHNAAWLGVEWVNGDRTAVDIPALAEDLSKQQIRYVFVFVSYMKPSGRFNPTYSGAAEFVHALRAENPEFSVQAWIGLPLENRPGSGYVDLENPAVRSSVISFCVDMVQDLGFDGIHLDPEPVDDGDPSILVLLDELRRQIGPTPTVSMATRRLWPVKKIWLPTFASIAWQAGYYREIAQRVDQVAVMTYDSGLPLPYLYRRWVSMQVIQLSRALDDVQVHVLIGIPASEEWTPTHWPHAENMTSGLKGVIDGLGHPNTEPSAVTGVAIYPYWETDANEWAAYQSLWLKR